MWRGLGKSLRIRLFALTGLLLVLAWLITAVIAWFELKEGIDEFFDTQQALFARRLASSDMRSLTEHLPPTREMLGDYRAFHKGEEEDEALGFAVFTLSGRRVLSDGEHGSDFIFNPHVRGFVNTKIEDSDDAWRIVWIVSLDGEHIVAVGQELEYREDLVFDLLQAQLLPWLLVLPVVLAGMLLALGVGIRPLRRISANLQQRSPHDTTALPVQDVPSEIQPLVDALNIFFSRMEALLCRERAFTSDAAHELRTPLAALRVQAEVALLADSEGDQQEGRAARRKALGNLIQGIDRSSRLVEQLLVLSRLDGLTLSGQQTDERESLGGENALSAPLGKTQSREKLSLSDIVAQEVGSLREKAAAKGIAFAWSGEERLEFEGNGMLLSILFRNLLANAVSYGQSDQPLSLCLLARGLRIENAMQQPLSPDQLRRLGERFFRPAGQRESGSGLGLSIVKRIAQLHGMTLLLDMREADADGARPPVFIAELRW